MRSLRLGLGLLGAAGVAAAMGCFGDLNTQNDLDPPILRITAPQAGDTVFGLVLIQADAIDGFGVASVRFHVDNTLIFTDFVFPYQAVWNANGLSGTHSIRVEARDEAANTTSESISVVVANDPN
jgi:hypothetical protein